MNPNHIEHNNFNRRPEILRGEMNADLRRSKGEKISGQSRHCGRSGLSGRLWRRQRVECEAARAPLGPLRQLGPLRPLPSPGSLISGPAADKAFDQLRQLVAVAAFQDRCCGNIGFAKPGTEPVKMVGFES